MHWDKSVCFMTWNAWQMIKTFRLSNEPNCVQDFLIRLCAPLKSGYFGNIPKYCPKAESEKPQDIPAIFITVFPAIIRTEDIALIIT